jgi:hypothetical protein
VVEFDVFEESFCEFELFLPLGGSEIVELTGSSSWEVYFEGSLEGIAFDDTGNGLDEVATEMTGLELNGFTPLLGPVSLTINSVFTSMGQIEETSDVSTGILDVQPFGPLGSTADAFFDVFVELSFGGQTYRNIAPMRLSGLASFLYRLV